MIKKLWGDFLKWWKKDPEEAEREEEFKNFFEDVIKKTQSVPKPILSMHDKMQVVLMAENAYTQKKITEASESTKMATWILAGATAIFAWVAIKDSSHSNEILRTLSQIGEVILFIIIIGIGISILGKIIKFLVRSILRK